MRLPSAKALLVAIFLPGVCLGQYSFDVKTPMAEKHQLQNVKAGVLTTIGNSTWATVTEVGEDYSLWMMDLQRQAAGDSMRVSVRVELRTKAMFTRGRFLDSTRVSISYDRAKAKAFVADSVSVNLAETATPEDFGSAAEALGGVAAMAGLTTGIPFAGQLSGAVLGDVVQRLSGVLRRHPSTLEALEALWIGHEIMAATERLVVKEPKSPDDLKSRLLE